MTFSSNISAILLFLIRAALPQLCKQEGELVTYLAVVIGLYGEQVRFVADKNSTMIDIERSHLWIEVVFRIIILRFLPSAIHISSIFGFF